MSASLHFLHRCPGAMCGHDPGKMMCSMERSISSSRDGLSMLSMVKGLTHSSERKATPRRIYSYTRASVTIFCGVIPLFEFNGPYDDAQLEAPPSITLFSWDLASPCASTKILSAGSGGLGLSLQPSRDAKRYTYDVIFLAHRISPLIFCVFFFGRP